MENDLRERPLVLSLVDTDTSPPDLPFPGRLLIIGTPVGPMRVWRARDPYRLLEDPQVQADFEKDQRMPYWAELWASSVYLATRMINEPELVAEKRVLEVGAGLGFPGVAAAKAGAGEVVITDLAPQALAAAKVTVRENGLQDDPRVRLELMDLYYPREDLGLFDVVIAGDVLFERRLRHPLLLCTKAMLHPEGQACLLDPNREWVQDFDEEAREVGFVVRVESVPYMDLDDRPVTINLYHLSHRT